MALHNLYCQSSGSRAAITFLFLCINITSLAAQSDQSQAMTVEPAVQAKRDKDRLQILRTELANQIANVQELRNQESQLRARNVPAERLSGHLERIREEESNLASLRREIELATNKTPTSRAIIAGKASPAASKGTPAAEIDAFGQSDRPNWLAF